MTLSATTVEAERSFLCMRRVKTWLRSAMTSDLLSDLCVLHSHHERADKEQIKSRLIEYWQSWLAKSDDELISDRKELEVKFIQL